MTSGLYDFGMMNLMFDNAQVELYLRCLFRSFSF